MSMDKSLKSRAGLVRHRNVLTRAERIRRLEDEERITPENSVFGLPKVKNILKRTGSKKKAAEKEPEKTEVKAE